MERRSGRTYNPPRQLELGLANIPTSLSSPPPGRAAGANATNADRAVDAPARVPRGRAMRRQPGATPMSVEKIATAPGSQGGALRPPVLSSSGAAQSREPGAAVRHADGLLQLASSQVGEIDEDLGVRPRRRPSAPVSSDGCGGVPGQVQLWPPGRSLASRATAATGNSSWRCARW